MGQHKFNPVGNRDGKCDSCQHEEDYPCCVDCLDKMHTHAADAIEALQKELRLCRNELCQHCGEYIREYAGACDGCRWYAFEREGN